MRTKEEKAELLRRAIKNGASLIPNNGMLMRMLRSAASNADSYIRPDNVDGILETFERFAKFADAVVEHIRDEKAEAPQLEEAHAD